MAETPVDRPLERAAKAAKEKGLPGKIARNADGLIEQEDYGLWPTCSICHEQVQPTEFNDHAHSHVQGAKAAPAVKDEDEEPDPQA